MAASDISRKRHELARASEELKTLQENWINYTRQRLAVINERLKEICPHNDLEQGRRLIEEERERQRKEVYGTYDLYKTSRKISDKLTYETQKMTIHLPFQFTQDMKFRGMPDGKFRRRDDRFEVTAERREEFVVAVREHYAAELERLRRECDQRVDTFLAAMAAGEKTIDDLNRQDAEHDEKARALDEEMCRRYPRDPERDNNMLYGAVVHRNEIQRLKDERRHLVDTWNKSDGERCPNCKDIREIDISGKYRWEDHRHKDQDSYYYDSMYTCTYKK